MRIIRAVTDRRQIISFPLFVCKDTLEDKSYLVYFVDVSSAGSRMRPEGPKRFFFGDRPPLSLRSGSGTGIQVSGFA